MMVAEGYMNGRPDLVRRFVNREQFHQAFAFDLMLAAWNKEAIETALDDSFVVFEEGVPPTWTLNNHDVQRIVTRLGRDNATESHRPTSHLDDSWHAVDVEVGRRRAAAAIALAMALPGSIYLYQGEELGLPEVLDLPDDRREDPVFHHTNGQRIGRDGCRVPLPWVNDPGSSFGFSSRPAVGSEPGPPWLPQPDWWGDFAVSELEDRDGSMLELYRQLIRARREHAVPQGGHAAVIDVGAGLVAVRRGDLIVVANVTRDPITLDLDHPELAIVRPVVATAPEEMHTPGVIPPDSTIWFIS